MKFITGVRNFRSACMLIAALSLTSCATAPTGPRDYGPEPTADGARAAIHQLLRVTLKDPDSVKDLVVARPHPDCFYRGLLYGGGFYCGHVVCVSYNAKNSFGAYIGSQVYVYWFRGNEVNGGVYPNGGACPAYLTAASDWQPEPAPVVPVTDYAAEATLAASDGCDAEMRERLLAKGMSAADVADVCGDIDTEVKVTGCAKEYEQRLRDQGRSLVEVAELCRKQ